MKRIFVFLIFLPVLLSNDFDFTLPEVHADIAVQYESYYGEDDTVIGYVAPSDKIVVRHAAFHIEGSLGDRVEYSFEAGSATCMGGGSQILLMEAIVLYKPMKYINLGLMKGHIKRGFELEEECTNVLTAEKPKFGKTFSPCHPTGFIVNYTKMEKGKFGIDAQLGILNGPKGIIDDEHDINLGLSLHSPCRAFAVGGFYTNWKEDFNYSGDSDPGYRYGIGIDVNKFNVKLRAEYFAGKGFYSHFEDTESKDLQMDAFYAQGAYPVLLGNEILHSFEPYLRYQLWDKASNLDQQESTYDYLTMGIALTMADTHTKFRIDYEMPISQHKSSSEEASSLIIRLQSGF
ncbi:MAG: hypothetical protein ACLFSQ_07505 [Candidatus Zixiibacteriota bacterium]